MSALAFLAFAAHSLQVAINIQRVTLKSSSLLFQSHAGKVVLRHWYEKNKHIFPANRWESYDPEKKWEKYTVRLLEL